MSRTSTTAALINVAVKWLEDHAGVQSPTSGHIATGMVEEIEQALASVTEKSGADDLQMVSRVVDSASRNMPFLKEAAHKVEILAINKGRVEPYSPPAYLDYQAAQRYLDATRYRKP